MKKDIVCSQQVIDREDVHSTGQLGRKAVEASDACHVVPDPLTYTQVSRDCFEENIITRLFETEMFKFYLCQRIAKRYFGLQLQSLKNQCGKLSDFNHLLSKSLCMPLSLQVSICQNPVLGLYFINPYFRKIIMVASQLHFHRSLSP